ncbi:MAG: histidine phosphatase family protein, partial [Actinobacteria bacterium]
MDRWGDTEAGPPRVLAQPRAPLLLGHGRLDRFRVRGALRRRLRVPQPQAARALRGTFGVTRLVLIRHGLAQCAVDSIVGGIKGCTGLAPDGRTQAERLRDRLLRTGELRDADAVYTSVLPRAIETAEIIAPGLGRAGEAPAKQDADLCELNP